jgi:hypothetical protein
MFMSPSGVVVWQLDKAETHYTQNLNSKFNNNE